MITPLCQWLGVQLQSQSLSIVGQPSYCGSENKLLAVTDEHPQILLQQFKMLWTLNFCPAILTEVTALVVLSAERNMCHLVPVSSVLDHVHSPPAAEARKSGSALLGPCSTWNVCNRNCRDLSVQIPIVGQLRNGITLLSFTELKSLRGKACFSFRQIQWFHLHYGVISETSRNMKGLSLQQIVICSMCQYSVQNLLTYFLSKYTNRGIPILLIAKYIFRNYGECVFSFVTIQLFYSKW